MNSFIKMKIERANYAHSKYFGKWWIQSELYYQYLGGFPGTWYPLMETYIDVEPSIKSVLETSICIWNDETFKEIITDFCGKCDKKHNQIAGKMILDHINQDDIDQEHKDYPYRTEWISCVVYIVNDKIIDHKEISC